MVRDDRDGVKGAGGWEGPGTGNREALGVPPKGKHPCGVLAARSELSYSRRCSEQRAGGTHGASKVGVVRRLFRELQLRRRLPVSRVTGGTADGAAHPGRV